MAGTGIKVSVRERDRGMNKFQEAVAELAKSDPHVRVGVFSDEKAGGQVRDGELTNVEIAAVHEYGTEDGRVPERSFLRSTFDEKRQVYAALVTKLLRGVVSGKMPVKQMFDILGAQMVADINGRVRQTLGPAFAFEPLRPETIARKGSDRPLIDTGIMLASITWVTVTKGAASTGAPAAAEETVLV